MTFKHIQRYIDAHPDITAEARYLCSVSESELLTAFGDFADEVQANEEDRKVIYLWVLMARLEILYMDYSSKKGSLTGENQKKLLKSMDEDLAFIIDSYKKLPKNRNDIALSRFILSLKLHLQDPTSQMSVSRDDPRVIESKLYADDIFESGRQTPLPPQVITRPKSASPSESPPPMPASESRPAKQRTLSVVSSTTEEPTEVKEKSEPPAKPKAKPKPKQKGTQGESKPGAKGKAKARTVVETDGSDASDNNDQQEKEPRNRKRKVKSAEVVKDETEEEESPAKPTKKRRTRASKSPKKDPLVAEHSDADAPPEQITTTSPLSVLQTIPCKNCQDKNKAPGPGVLQTRKPVIECRLLAGHTACARCQNIRKKCEWPDGGPEMPSEILDQHFKQKAAEQGAKANARKTKKDPEEPVPGPSGTNSGSVAGKRKLPKDTPRVKADGPPVDTQSPVDRKSEDMQVDDPPASLPGPSDESTSGLRDMLQRVLDGQAWLAAHVKQLSNTVTTTEATVRTAANVVDTLRKTQVDQGALLDRMIQQLDDTSRQSIFGQSQSKPSRPSILSGFSCVDPQELAPGQGISSILGQPGRGASSGPLFGNLRSSPPALGPGDGLDDV